MEMNISEELTKVAEKFADDYEGMYKEKQRQIDDLLKQLERGLKKHDKKFQKGMKNYGYIGDLGHVVEQLQEVVDFLK